MKNYLSIIAILLFVGNIALGQGYTFKVLANKGDNKVKSGADWKALKTGASLNDNDEIEVSDNAYLGLVHSSGKTVELKSAGNHKVKDLASNVKAGGSSVASKYADFVLSKMSEEKKGNRLSATGAVKRGGDGEIDLFIPESADIFNDKGVVKWLPPSDEEKTYVVVFQTLAEEVLLSVETTDSKVEFDISDEKMSMEPVILISVQEKGKPAKKDDRRILKRLNAGDTQKIKEKLENLMSDVSEETALNKYLLAGFYEDEGLIVDALTSYEQAIKLAPDVVSYREAYEDFLYRQGFLKEE